MTGSRTIGPSRQPELFERPRSLHFLDRVHSVVSPIGLPLWCGCFMAKRARHVMTPDPVCCSPGTTLERARPS
jgi:hypothetical protein